MVWFGRLGWGLAAVSAVAAQAPAPVEGRLVTVDVVALDPYDGTVADLAREEFQLFVDGTDTPVEGFNTYCDDGAQDDPKTYLAGHWETPLNVDGRTRRIVFVFDYLHLTTPCSGMEANPGDPPCGFHTYVLLQ